MRVFSILALATGALAQSSVPLPTLPTGFSAWVACNIGNRNYTVTIHEMYDQATDRALLSSYHPTSSDLNYRPPSSSRRRLSGFNFTNFTGFGNTTFNRTSSGQYGWTGVSRTLYDYGTGVFYHYNDTDCYAGNISLHRRGRFTTSDAPGHIPSVSQWFDFGRGQPYNEQYMGPTTFDGKTVNQWRSIQNNATANTTMTLDYYFSTPTWAVWRSNYSQVPVALVLSGSRPNYSFNFSNGNFSFFQNGTHVYNHTYVFNGFHTGPSMYPNMFMIPAGVKCRSIDGVDASRAPVMSASVASSSDGGMSAGGVAGIAILSAVLGGVVAFVVSRRAPASGTASATKSQPTFNNALSVDGPAADSAEDGDTNA